MNTQEVYHKISSLCQNYVKSIVSKNIFQKRYLVSLPCYQLVYLSAILKDLDEDVTIESSFTLLDLTTLCTKSKPLKDM